MLLQRIFIALVLISTFGHAIAFADVTVIEGRTINPPGASPVGDSGTIFKLEITPAKEASPAFKHRFTVPPHETIAGNAITHYLRSLGERGLHRPWDYAEEQSDRAVHQWYQLRTKTEDIPIDKLKQCSAVFDGFIDIHMRRATQCRYADWGYAVEDLTGAEAIGFLLPSVQNTRMMARAMLLQNRLALMEGRYDDSIDRLRMIYQLGRNVNEMGILVTSLVGLAEVEMGNQGALQLIGEENSPNLYWALAGLPTPVIDARRSVQLDLSLVQRLFPEVMDIENANYSDDEWKRLLNKYASAISEYSTMVSGWQGQPKDSSSPQSITFLGSIAGYANAKKRLIELGYEKAKVEDMCVAQVILTDAVLDAQYFSQLNEKSWYVPYAQSKAINGAFEEELKDAESDFRLGAMIAGLITPAAQQVRMTAVRTQGHLNLLMAIESLRNHAAVHGKFPASLNELSLPVRDNPITEKPFGYSLESGKAVLTFDRDRGVIHRYEISIKK